MSRKHKKDGENWLEEVIITDYFSGEENLEDTIYVTKIIQQQNGCFYRLIVVYSLERKVWSKKFWFIKIDDIEELKVAEVYNFYVKDKDISEVISPNNIPKKELGKKVNTGLDTGFFENNIVDLDDPHYGWNIGSFFVNGYTREVISEDGGSVFLKNVGDRVAFWFNLEQELEALNVNDSSYTIIKKLTCLFY